MKRIKIYQRRVLERTGYRKYPYKEDTQYHMIYDGKDFSNCDVSLDNPKLRITFKCVLDTRVKEHLINYYKTLNRTEADKWLKGKIEEVLNV